MSIDLPPAIEPDILKYASDANITADEAVVRLIRAGLDASNNEATRVRDLLGEPANEDDASLIDEVVQTAMDARTTRWEPRVDA